MTILTATLHELKLSISLKQAFKTLLGRVGMNVWTLGFLPDFERSYRAHLLNHAILRIRYTMAVGFLFVLIKGGTDLFQSQDRAWTVG